MKYGCKVRPKPGISAQHLISVHDSAIWQVIEFPMFGSLKMLPKHSENIKFLVYLIVNIDIYWIW